MSSGSMKVLLYHFNNKVPTTLSPRFLHAMDVTFVVSGTLSYILDGEKIELHSGDAIVMLPGSTRERIAGTELALYASFNVLCPEGVVPPVSGRIPNVVTRNIVFFLETFQTEWETASDYRIPMCDALFMYLYNHLLNTVNKLKNPYIQKIKQYIETNLDEKITLEDIGAHVHLAPGYVSSLFRAETGQGLFEYIIACRIDHAKRLLLVYDYPLSEIASLSGFPDYNYFSHIFKKKVGVSPRKYKKDRLQSR